MDRILGIVAVIGLVLLGAVSPATAKGKKAAAGSPAAGKQVNACGCYADGTGACFCGRKGKCVCPGECEPKGCEEKRAKEMQKEVAAETKKAAEADKKARQAEASGKSQATGKPQGDKGKPAKEKKPAQNPVQKDDSGP
jgi:hypothetical protein